MNELIDYINLLLNGILKFSFSNCLYDTEIQLFLYIDSVSYSFANPTY